MKAKLTFTIPEEDPEFKLAYYGPDMYLAICELDQQFRNWIKHGGVPDNLKTPEDVMHYVRGHFSEVLGKVE